MDRSADPGCAIGLRQQLRAALGAICHLLPGSKKRPAEEPKESYLCITSKLKGSATTWAEPSKEYYGHGKAWEGHCAVCKRPLILETWEPVKKRRSDGGRCAYVVAVWGQNPEYLLGAMVLGHSLRRTGTQHTLLAIHTKDVPAAGVALLERAGWRPYEVDYVEACETLFQDYTLKGRFANVFTKLRVLGLVEFDKVLMLDADLLVCQNIDNLFELEPPAALARGVLVGSAHGERIDGRYFFAGRRPTDLTSWGQCGGINAGVMLLQPDYRTLEQCLAEVADLKHPEHIQGRGPEQDYLSRYFAGEWRHISVEYNFQLHQMYFALEPLKQEWTDRRAFIGHPELVKVFHYSSEPKPWARLLDPSFAGISEEDWLYEILSKFSGYRAWVLKDPAAVESDVDHTGVALGPDGHLYRVVYGEDGKELMQEVAAPMETSTASSSQKGSDRDGLHSQTHHGVDCPEDQDALSEEIVGVSMKEKQDDKLIGRKVRQVVNGTELSGTVEDVDFGKDSQEKLYRVRYLDGDLQHMTAAQVELSSDAPKDAAGESPAAVTKVRVLGERLEVPEELIKGAELVVRRCLKMWDEAYEDMVRALGDPKLPETVVAAMASEPQVVDDVEKELDPDAKGWGKVRGWWFQRHLREKPLLFASSSYREQARALISIDGQELLSATSIGVHLAAWLPSEGGDSSSSTSPSAPEMRRRSFLLPSRDVAAPSLEEVTEWAAAIPHGAAVALSLIDPSGGEAAVPILEALSNGGLGCPKGALPDGCMVAAAVGWKTTSCAPWYETQAGRFTAAATGPN